MRTPLNIISYRLMTFSLTLLLLAAIYHLAICPIDQPKPLVLFPTITLQTNLNYAVGQPQVGDQVLIMKKYVGVVTATNELNYHCSVLYLNVKAGRGTPVLGRFPYTVLQRIQIND